MAKKRVDIPQRLRTQLLIAAQHACCVCGKPGVQIHHINDDPSDNDPENLAVLCLPHHDEATKPRGLSARLRPEEVTQYKRKWEAACRDRMRLAARSRTAFFMVDYKNTERIREIYSQIDPALRATLPETLEHEFKEEETKRVEQGFDTSLEPNTRWSSNTHKMLSLVASGDPHPRPFKHCPGHPKDPLYPWGPSVAHTPDIALYDLWCQIMVRAIVAACPTLDFNDVVAAADPTGLVLTPGTLLAFEGRLKGKVAAPSQWESLPTGETRLTIRGKKSTWVTTLTVKTHYVYSDTAAASLGRGSASGILALRSIDSIERLKTRWRMTFSAIPLIIGIGSLKL